MALQFGDPDMTILFVVIGLAILVSVIISCLISCYICRFKCPWSERTVLPPPHVMSPLYVQPDEFPGSAIMIRETSHPRRAYISQTLPKGHQQRPVKKYVTQSLPRGQHHKQVTQYISHSLPRRQHQRRVVHTKHHSLPKQRQYRKANVENSNRKRKEKNVKQHSQTIIKHKNRGMVHPSINGYIPRTLKNKKIQTNLSDSATIDSRSTSRQSSFTQTNITHQDAVIYPRSSYLYSEVDLQKKVKDKNNMQASNIESNIQSSNIEPNAHSDVMTQTVVTGSDVESSIQNSAAYSEVDIQNSIEDRNIIQTSHIESNEQNSNIDSNAQNEVMEIRAVTESDEDSTIQITPMGIGTYIEQVHNGEEFAL